jgi:hypothetical protein
MEGGGAVLRLPPCDHLERWRIGPGRRAGAVSGPPGRYQPRPRSQSTARAFQSSVPGIVLPVLRP